MSVSGFSFWLWRFLEIITLIPIVGMLAYFVNIFAMNNQLTPSSILVLFVVSVLAVVWALGTLFVYSRARYSASFVALVDLLFVGAFIGGVYALRDIGNADCTSVEKHDYSVNLGIAYIGSNDAPTLQTNKECAMLKASWAFGIMNCIFFFITFVSFMCAH